MVNVKEDLTGNRFGKLLVLQQAEDYIEGGKHRAQWLCQCDCGSDPIIVRGYSLKRKKHPTTSCGCLRKEKPKEKNKKYNKWLDEIFADEHGEYRIGFTSNTNKEFYVDVDDYNKVKEYCWCETVATNGYHFLSAWDSNLKKVTRMPWVIGCAKYNHIDKNALNNRRVNLIPRASMELNNYDYSHEYGVGYCRNTGTEFYFDWKDYDLIKDYCWNEHIKTNGYHALEAYDSSTKCSITMAKLLGYRWHDHENRDPLDNRRDNLRPATPKENSRNKSKQKNNVSGITGVGYKKDNNLWRARITYNGNQIHIGYFNNKHDAIIARLNAEKQYFGEFSPQRHLFEQYGIKEDK